MEVTFITLNEHAQSPVKGRDLDAAYDLHVTESHMLEPGDIHLFSTGIAVSIPEGHAGLVLPRSGLACKLGITVINAPGLIDPGYTGEVKVGLINHGRESHTIEMGERVAQLLIVRCENVVWAAAESLSESERGEGGFGSSGR